VRLNRYLSQCGLGSRRGCEQIILEGRVTINGKTVTELGTVVAPEDSVSVDGKPTRAETPIVIALNKPKGYICSRADERDRMTIYALLIPAFFAPPWRGWVLWGVYMSGIVVAIGVARLLRGTLFRGETAPFVMELPPYRLPTLRSVGIHMWDRAWMYLQKAGTVILALSILLWALGTFPRLPEGPAAAAADRQTQALEYSAIGRMGKALEPAIRPLGFDWRVGTALVGAFAAKEVFVAQMGIVFAVGEADETSDQLREQLRARYTPLVGLCIMMFALIATPCIATFAITRQESGSVRFALAQTAGLTALAWVITFGVYQVGMLLKLGVG